MHFHGWNYIKKSVCAARAIYPSHSLSLAPTRMRREAMHLDIAREFHFEYSCWPRSTHGATRRKRVSACLQAVCCPSSCQRTTLPRCQRRSRSTLYLTLPLSQLRFLIRKTSLRIKSYSQLCSIDCSELVHQGMMVPAIRSTSATGNSPFTVALGATDSIPTGTWPTSSYRLSTSQGSANETR